MSCSKLVSMEIGQTVSAIAPNAFADCRNLEAINVAENNPVYASVDGVLYNKSQNQILVWPATKVCTGFPSTGTSIGDFAFCSYNFQTIAIPETVTYIGNGAFYDSQLTSIELPNSITAINNSTFALCRRLTSIKIPASVTKIDNSAFYYCNRLVSVEIPESVVSIGDWAFYTCTFLDSLYLPNSVTTIGGNAFNYCHIATINIPASITTIADNAFKYCYWLSKIYCEPTVPLYCEPAFPRDAYEEAILYVPKGTIEAYKNTYPWSNFTNIQEMDFTTGVTNAIATDNDVTVRTEGGNIVVNGANGADIQVCTLSGTTLYHGKATTIPVNVPGIYVVKVNKQTFKVVVK